jgi:hypothetical protein
LSSTLIPEALTAGPDGAFGVGLGGTSGPLGGRTGVVQTSLLKAAVPPAITPGWGQPAALTPGRGPTAAVATAASMLADSVTSAIITTRDMSCFIKVNFGL